MSEAGHVTIETSVGDGGEVSVPAFRLDNEQAAFRFTATLSDRGGNPIERLPTPTRLDDWLTANDLRLGLERATGAHLDLARRLREAIHRVGTAVAAGSTPRSVDVECLNSESRDSQTYPELEDGRLRWANRSDEPIRAALGLIAQDAIAVLGGPQRDDVKACENPDCGGLYVDTSRGRNRRWCSMNICGNRAKKAKFRHKGG